MPKDDRIYIRVSEAKKIRIKKRADSLDKSVSEHLLYCYDQELAISEGRRVVVPTTALGDLKREDLKEDDTNPF